MKESRRQMLVAAGLCASFVATGSASVLSAQSTVRRVPPADVTRLMVPALKSSDKKVGVLAEDAIISRLNQDISYKQLWVIPKNDVANTLEASGFPPNEPLSPNDAKELAKILRADEYLEGTVTKTPKGFRLDTRLVLARDNALVQPLPPVEAARLDAASAMLSKEFQAARKQLDSEKKCIQALRDSKYPDAVLHANAGIVAYPKSTIARVCLANAYVLMKHPTDSVLRVTSEVLAIHPENRLALGFAAQAYKDAGNGDKAVETWTKLISTDPTNTKLVDAGVREIAASGNAIVARPIIEDAVKQNPGDPSLMKLQWLILLAIKDYKGAVTVGESMIAADTALADTTYFQRLASAYASDSQPQKSAEALARGTAKFPANSGLQLLYAQQLRTSGQPQQAIMVLRKLPPKTPRVNLQIAQAQSEINQPDSALVSLRAAAAAGDSVPLLGAYALSIGNNLYKAANASKNRDDLARAVTFLTLSDSLAPSPQAKFLTGLASFTIGQTAATEAGKSKNCALAKVAQEAFTTAQIKLPAGGSFAPDATKTYLGYLAQFTPVVDNQVKQFCK